MRPTATPSAPSLWMTGRLVRLLNPSLGSSFGLRQGSARGQRCTVVINRCTALGLQIKNPSQVDVGPGYNLRFLRNFQGTLEVSAGALHVPVHRSHLGQNEQGTARILSFFIQGLLRQLLSSARIAYR